MTAHLGILRQLRKRPVPPAESGQNFYAMMDNTKMAA